DLRPLRIDVIVRLGVHRAVCDIRCLARLVLGVGAEGDELARCLHARGALQDAPALVAVNALVPGDRDRGAAVDRGLGATVPGWTDVNLARAQELRGLRTTRPPDVDAWLDLIPTVSLDVISLVANSWGYYRGHIEPHAAQ